MIAVASRDLQRGRRFASAFGIPTVSKSLDALLRSEEVDAVYIANVTAEHATTVISALEAGKAVLCEKPLALSADEAERVVEVARRTRRLCMEGIWTSFLPAYLRFLELARTRTCGDPTHLFADFGYPVREDALPRLFSPAAGGVLLDRGIYLIALALKVFGPIERVDALIDVTDSGVDRHVSMQLNHAGGGQSQLSASFSALMSNTAALACSGGIIRLGEPLIGAETVSTRVMAAMRTAPQDPALPLRSRKIVNTLRQSPLLRRFKQALPNARLEHLSYGLDRYRPQLEHFLALMKAGERESGVVPLELSLAIQRVIGQARAGHRH